MRETDSGHLGSDLRVALQWATFKTVYGLRSSSKLVKVQPVFFLGQELFAMARRMSPAVILIDEPGPRRPPGALDFSFPLRSASQLLEVSGLWRLAVQGWAAEGFQQHALSRLCEASSRLVSLQSRRSLPCWLEPPPSQTFRLDYIGRRRGEESPCEFRLRNCVAVSVGVVVTFRSAGTSAAEKGFHLLQPELDCMLCANGRIVAYLAALEM